MSLCYHFVLLKAGQLRGGISSPGALFLVPLLSVYWGLHGDQEPHLTAWHPQESRIAQPLISSDPWKTQVFSYNANTRPKLGEACRSGNRNHLLKEAPRTRECVWVSLSLNSSPTNSSFLCGFFWGMEGGVEPSIRVLSSVTDWRPPPMLRKAAHQNVPWYLLGNPTQCWGDKRKLQTASVSCEELGLLAPSCSPFQSSRFVRDVLVNRTYQQLRILALRSSSRLFPGLHTQSMRGCWKPGPAGSNRPSPSPTICWRAELTRQECDRSVSCKGGGKMIRELGERRSPVRSRILQILFPWYPTLQIFHLEGKNKCISYQNFHEVEAEAGRGEGRENLIALEVFFVCFCLFVFALPGKEAELKGRRARGETWYWQVEVSQEFIYLMSKYCLSIYYTPDPVLDVEDIAVNKIEISDLTKFSFKRERQEIKMAIKKKLKWQNYNKTLSLAHSHTMWMPHILLLFLLGWLFMSKSRVVVYNWRKNITLSRETEKRSLNILEGSWDGYCHKQESDSAICAYKISGTSIGILGPNLT